MCGNTEITSRFVAIHSDSQSPPAVIQAALRAALHFRPRPVTQVRIAPRHAFPRAPNLNFECNRSVTAAPTAAGPQSRKGAVRVPPTYFYIKLLSVLPESLSVMSFSDRNARFRRVLPIEITRAGGA